MLKGIAASPGIVIGKVLVFDREEFKVERRELKGAEIEAEIKRLKQALAVTQEELLAIKNRLVQEMGEEHAYIFDAHLLLLRDPMFIAEITQGIEKERLNAEYAIHRALDKFTQKFATIGDEYLKERISDIHDVGLRILRNLAGKKGRTLAYLKEDVIVVARDLSPSDTAQMHKERVIGFATDIGGRTSHTAIMARALQIPAVVGLKNISQRVRTGETIIIDGIHGIVIINPDSQTLKEYQRARAKFKALERVWRKLRDLPAETLDGYQVEVAANIELPREVKTVLDRGAKGIGLFRTEFLYLNRSDLPSEEEQYGVYKRVAERLKPYPVIIRTLDLGGDKFLSQLGLPAEINPFLGLRGIRLCFECLELFKIQLRAILRASAPGNLKLLYPLISGVNELRYANQILEEVKDELKRKEILFDANLEVGAMIETPAAAMIADLLAKEVDFFSIGTNDLIQYAVGIDRVNEKVAYLYEPLHPAILRLIKKIVDDAHQEGIWVGMCGEMAGDPLSVVILLGMGLDEFSTEPVAVPEIKRVIRSVTKAEAQEIAEKVIGFSTAQEVEEYVRQRMGELLAEF